MSPGESPSLGGDHALRWQSGCKEPLEPSFRGAQHLFRVTTVKWTAGRPLVLLGGYGCGRSLVSTALCSSPSFSCPPRPSVQVPLGADRRLVWAAGDWTTCSQPHAGAQLWDDASLPQGGPTGDLPLWTREAPDLPDAHRCPAPGSTVHSLPSWLWVKILPLCRSRAGP